MANIDASGARTIHGTLVAAQVDLVTFAGNPRQVEVANRSASEIFVRTGGVPAAVGGAGSLLILPNSAKVINNVTPIDTIGRPAGSCQVSIVTTGAAVTYSMSVL